MENIPTGERAKRAVRPVKKNRPIREQVTENLRDAIIDMSFLPGERLVEGELCELLGTSRASLRQALRVLESEGLVRTRNGRGIFVNVLDPQEAVELYDVRANLESLLARLFVEKATAQELDRAAYLIEEMVAAVKRPNFNAEIIHGTEDLYKLMFQVSQNKTLEQYLQLIHRRIPQFRAATVSYPGRSEEAADGLRRFATAALDKDAAGAAKAMEEYVLKAGRVARKIASERAK